MRPLVTVLITAYNYGGYIARAIESALAQDHGADRLDIVVVDDGSTDDTPDVVRPYLDRIRYFRQENAGVMAATGHGLQQARGEFIAFLDADDMWLPHRISTQLAIFRERPEVGLIAGEMHVVDDDDRITVPRYFANLGIVPPAGWVMGTYIRQNLSPTATITMRASLKHALLPVAEDASYQDWWVSACLAERTEFHWIADPVACYRAHTGQLSSFEVHDASWVKVQQKDNRFRRWIFRNLDLGRVTVDDLAAAWAKLDEHLGLVARSWGVPAHELLPVTDDDRAAAAAYAERADADLAVDDFGGAARSLLAAMAEDPFDLQLRARFDAAARAVDPVADPMLPDTRGFVAFATAEDLLARPELLSTYAQAFDAGDDATLAIDLAGASPDALEQLLAELRLDSAAAPDMVCASLPPGRATENMLRRRVHAFLGADADPHSLRGMAAEVWERRPRHYSDARTRPELAA
jgi:glycosyltransferase involved in cell wall biosynthesis